MILDGRIKARGVRPPETCVPVRRSSRALAARGMPVRASLVRPT